MLAVLALLMGLQVLSTWVAFWLLKRWVEAQKKALIDQGRAFLESHDDQPSPLAILTDQFASLFAGRLWQYVEARLRGAAGTVAREDAKDAELAVGASGPLAALAMAFLPKKAKMMLMKNPQFLASLGSLVGGKSQGSNGSGSPESKNFKMEM